MSQSPHARIYAWRPASGSAPVDWLPPRELATLQSSLERFANAWSHELSVLGRRDVKVALTGLARTSLGGYAGARVTGHSFNILRSEGARSPAVLAFNADLLALGVQVFLGGAHAPTVFGTGVVNMRLARRLAVHAAELLSAAFPEAAAMALRWTRQETQLASAGLMADEEPVAVCDFTVEIDGRLGVMTLVMPVQALRQHLEQAHERAKAQDLESASMLRSAVSAASVLLTGVLGKVTLSVRELLELKRGDVLRLDAVAGEPALLAVEGRGKWRAELGIEKGRRVLKIV